jgi:hypothetical protein
MLLAMTAYHDARCGRGRDGCADRAQDALADGRLLDEEASGAFVYACRVLVVADRYRAAATAYERALERARERGSITLFALAMAFRGSLGIHRGVLADAEADARAALDAARVGGATTALPFSLTYLALALIEQGELEGAAASLERFAQEVQHFGDMPFFLLVSGRLRRAQGDAEGALAAALEAAEGYSARLSPGRMPSPPRSGSNQHAPAGPMRWQQAPRSKPSSSRCRVSRCGPQTPSQGQPPLSDCRSAWSSSYSAPRRRSRSAPSGTCDVAARLHVPDSAALTGATC